MKQRSKPAVFIISAALLSAAVCMAELLERAPDVLPGTTAEMRNPSYWTSQIKNPDQIILAPGEINRMNSTYRDKLQADDPFSFIPEEKKSKLEHYYPGIELRITDLDKISPAALSDTVKRKINIEIEYLRGREYGNPNGVKYSEREIATLENEMAFAGIPDRITYREGIAVRCTHLKNVPAFSPAYSGIVLNGRLRWDLWDIGVLKIGKPVHVLHTSLSGEFLLVLCEIGYGWVRSEDVAFGEKEDIDAYVNADTFSVCTGDRVQYYSDKSCVYVSGWFRMGDRLPLVSSGNTRLVKVPVRRVNGTFSTEEAWLAENADVHVGLLPYTRRNIVETAFKLLDNPYDFNGTWFGRQHETTYRDIFACFGFDLPYHGGLFTHFGDNSTVLTPEVGTEKQYQTILDFEPFVTIMITLQDRGGHCQLLLGEHNGVPIVFDQHGYGYTDESGKELTIRRCCIGQITMPTYFLKRKVTFLELK